MSDSKESAAGLNGAQQKDLEERLRQVDEQFRREMRARGFVPSEADNLALTAPLARLYAEREQLSEELESLRESNSS
jgi:septation ring formation regulator EzrA